MFKTSVTSTFTPSETAQCIRQTLRSRHRGTDFHLVCSQGKNYGFMSLQWTGGPSREEVEHTLRPYVQEPAGGADRRFTCKGIDLVRTDEPIAAEVTAHQDGILVLSESVMFHDGNGSVITAAVDHDTSPAQVVVRIEGEELTVGLPTARALIAALTGMVNTAEIVGCLT